MQNQAHAVPSTVRSLPGAVYSLHATRFQRSEDGPKLGSPAAMALNVLLDALFTISVIAVNVISFVLITAVGTLSLRVELGPVGDLHRPYELHVCVGVAPEAGVFRSLAPEPPRTVYALCSTTQPIVAEPFVMPLSAFCARLPSRWAWLTESLSKSSPWQCLRLAELNSCSSASLRCRVRAVVSISCSNSLVPPNNCSMVSEVCSRTE
uniref:Uncharacterized protein n=1 Tax=Anopheles atroparvus TaxID=41427 RepID=A0A182IWI3_ANOAO